MKRMLFAFCLLLAAAVGLFAQSRMAGFGASYVMQSVNSEYEGATTNLSVNSIALGVDAFNGGILSMYTGASFGICLGGALRSGASTANLDMNDYSMKFSMSSVMGVGSMIGLGSFTLLVGAGLGIDAIMLEPTDMDSDILVSMAIGPGASVGCVYNITPGFGAYANVRGVYDMMQVVGLIPGYANGFSIAPTIGISISN